MCFLPACSMELLTDLSKGLGWADEAKALEGSEILDLCEIRFYIFV